MRRPSRTALRPVNKLITAPTPNKAAPEHAQAVANGAAAREQADHRADPEQGGPGHRDRRNQRAFGARDQKWRKRHERADAERKKRGQRRSPGGAKVFGIEAEFLARQRVER